MMQRPVMNPMLLKEAHDDDDDGGDGTAARRGPGLMRIVMRVVWATIRRVVRVLLSKPIRLSKRATGGHGDFVSRFAWGLAYRMLFLPILLALAAAALVYAGTHPPSANVDSDPRSFGVYYDPVNFVGADGVRLYGWLVPVIDAKRVLEKKDNVLRERFPAVVLVHDHGQSPQQMLPLVEPLHNDGAVVLVLALRGGMTDAQRAQTFGLHEASDVRAAVDMLRRRAFVDPDRIAVVGVGTGANAALLAAGQDGGVVAVAAADPVRSAEDVVRRRIVPDRPGFRWLQPVCKLAFEMSYQVDADELNLERLSNGLAHRPLLVLSGAASPDAPTARLDAKAVEQVRSFCQAHLAPPTVATVR